MKKRYWLLLVLILLVLATFFTGPRIPEPDYDLSLPDLPNNLEKLEEYVNSKEEALPVRKDNEARIVWQNEPYTTTEYSLVYLHGFAGSYRDGYPVNVKTADTLEANLYLSRWAGHGLKPPASLDNFSPEAAWESAKEALVIGEKIGKKVIILSTSTGGTLALKLAATYPDSVYAIINLSPYIEEDVEGAFVLNSPWGYEIAWIVAFGEEKKISHEEELARQYWDTIYPSKALVDLQVLLESVAKPETFKNIQCPVLTLYYHKNFLQEDEDVEVAGYPEMHELFSTPDSLKRLIPLEKPETHHIGSDIKSENTEVVLREIVDFLKEDLRIKVQPEPEEVP